jgi:hypothetical protein
MGRARVGRGIEVDEKMDGEKFCFFNIEKLWIIYRLYIYIVDNKL